MVSDYYSLLGLSKGASAAEIKKAYRKLALEWHPDRNKAEGAEKKFKEINQAYETLIDPEKKQMYDQVGHDRFNQQGGGQRPGGSYQSGPFSYTYSTSGGGNPFEGFDMGGFSDPFDIFDQFFGGGSRGRRQPRSLYQITISFQESVSGVTKKVTIDGKEKTLKVPAGVASNMQIRFADFDVIVMVQPDPRFKREGDDVFSEVKISLSSSLLGGKVEVETISGKKVVIKVKPGTAHGSMLRLQNKGFARVRGGGHGNHYVIFSILLPEHLTSKQKDLIKALQNEGL